MLEYKVIIVDDEYYIRASKHIRAEPDAVRGVHNFKEKKDIFIIARHSQDAHNQLVHALKANHYFADVPQV